MEFHTFGDNQNKAVVLIHGVFTPWQMWDYQIEKMQKDYYIIVPALDGHTSEMESEYISVEKEAEQIEDYILEHHGGKVYAVCGISMGGVISSILWKNNKIKMEKLVMDGAPLMKTPKFMTNIMANNYLKILHSSKERDPKTLEGFKKNLLPEKYLPDYLAFIDKTSDASVTNMIQSVFAGHYPENVKNPAKVLFLHGTKANEALAVKVAKRLKRDYPDMEFICHKGHFHCENALFHPENWYQDVEGFLK